MCIQVLECEKDLQSVRLTLEALMVPRLQLYAVLIDMSFQFECP